MLVAAVVWVTIDIDKPDLSLLRNFDLTGLVLMAIFLGCLEYALEEGPRWDWLDDSTIRTAVIVSVVAVGAVFLARADLSPADRRSARLPQPQLRARARSSPLSIGIGMYGTTYLVPLFLAQVRGFSAMQIGETVVVAGLAQMAMSPFSAQIARTLDLRVMLGIGLGLFAFSMYLTAGLTNQAGFRRAVRAAGRARHRADVLLSAGQSDRARHDAGRQAQERGRPLQPDARPRRRDRSGRDRHGPEHPAAFPLEPADRRHQPGAARRCSNFSTRRRTGLDVLVSGDPGRAAIKLLAQLVQREALVLTYNDVLMVFGVAFAIGLVLMPLVGRPQSRMAH